MQPADVRKLIIEYTDPIYRRIAAVEKKFDPKPEEPALDWSKETSGLVAWRRRAEHAEAELITLKQTVADLLTANKDLSLRLDWVSPRKQVTPPPPTMSMTSVNTGLGSLLARLAQPGETTLQSLVEHPPSPESRLTDALNSNADKDRIIKEQRDRMIELANELSALRAGNASWHVNPPIIPGDKA